MEYPLENIEDLMFLKLTGEITESEEKKLKEAIASSENIREHFEELMKAHQLLMAAQFSQNLNVEKAWDAISEKAAIPSPSHVEAPVISINTRKKVLRWVAAAILVPLFVVVGYLLLNKEQPRPIAHKSNDEIRIKLANGQEITLQQQKDLLVDAGSTSLQTSKGEKLFDAKGQPVDLAKYNTLSVPVGKDYHVVLADGSEVWLNAASSLNFPLSFAADSRTVELVGEAFFKVSKDPKKPFHVKVNGMDVQVLGTQFNVKAYPTETIQTSLVEGKVAIETGLKENVILKPGEAAFMAHPQSSLSIIPFDEMETLAWMKGLYFFKNEPLRLIIPVLERWYEVKIDVEDAALLNLSYSGALNKNNPVNFFLDVLKSASDLDYKFDGNTVILQKK